MVRTYALLLLLAASCTSPDPATTGAPDLPTATPESEGYSSALLAQVTAYAATIHAPAGMVIVDGNVIWTWGDVTAKEDIHSIRKSFLDGLYGSAVASGQIDLDTTLDQLGIDDVPPSLTATEKTATIQDLIEARSGVYHVALGETPSEVAERPARGSHAPGTFWYYNTWDFNTLGAIYNQLTNGDLFESFQSQIATPIGMQDFFLDDTRYETDPSVSSEPYYDFKMSTRDMARYGLLYLQGGMWNGQSLVPADWVVASTSSYSDTDRAGVVATATCGGSIRPAQGCSTTSISAPVRSRQKATAGITSSRFPRSTWSSSAAPTTATTSPIRPTTTSDRTGWARC